AHAHGAGDWGPSPLPELLNSPTTQLRWQESLKFVFAFSSGCRAAASPASGERRQPERLPYKQHAIASVVRRRKAEREREDSAAKLIRRMKMRRAGRCRVTVE